VSAPAGSVAHALRERGAAQWREAIEHPMVRAIGDGSLPRETFRFYLGQNVLYLEEYARAIALSAALTPDRDGLGVLSRFLAQIVENELPANLALLARAGGSPLVGGTAAMTAVTYDYTRHLLFAATRGPLSSALAALLPCQWSYGEIAATLAVSAPEDPLYAEWIAMFANPAYDQLVEATNTLLDRTALPTQTDDLSALFDRSTRYEAAFWQMAFSHDGSTRPITDPTKEENPHA
jgi:thiaminase/transcriptional activator TenA